MCVITDENYIVKSVSLIPGLNLTIPEGWHLFFPAINPPGIGRYFRDDECEIKLG